MAGTYTLYIPFKRGSEKHDMIAESLNAQESEADFRGSGEREVEVAEQTCDERENDQ